MPDSELAARITFFAKDDKAKLRSQSAEAILVERILAGDHEAFAELHKAFAPLVHGIVLARVPRARSMILHRKFSSRLTDLCTRSATRRRWVHGWR